MAGLVPAIHVFTWHTKDVDGRHKGGHDGGTACRADSEPDSCGVKPGHDGFVPS